MEGQTYGFFDDARREFVITRPDTPFPWINYLGNDGFYGLISNTAGGYCFYQDAKFRRIMRYRYNGVPMDSGGRYYYIVDSDAPAEPWNPGWKPCKTPLDHYECRHGMNYTRLNARKRGVEAQVLFFVPPATQAEVHKLTLKNLTTETKRLKLFSFVEWCLWNAATDMENFQRNFSTGEVEIEQSVPGGSPAGSAPSVPAGSAPSVSAGSAPFVPAGSAPFVPGGSPAGTTTIYHKTEYKERRNHYAFFSVNTSADGYDTDREQFIGLYNGFEAPQCVTEGKPRNSVAHGWSPIASHYIEVELQPGEQRDFIFVLGYVENEQEKKFVPDGSPVGTGLITSLGKLDRTIINKEKAHALISRFATVEAVDAAFRELQDQWDQLLGKFRVKSGDERLDRMVNIWNQYQCMVTFCFSRSASFFESGIGRGMGFRDSNQDLVGFVHQIPSRARQRIIDIASTQFPDGGCYHQYQPLTKRGNNDIGGGFNDDPLWLIFGTVAYLKETGDFSILDEQVPWDNQPGTEVPLFDHLRISFNHVVDNRGPHGLPLIGRADWNDCLNLNCFSWDPNESFQTTENKTEGSKAESLMIAGLFVFCGKQYAELCRHLAKEEEATRAEQAVQQMAEAVKQHGWDGEWYLRAYDYFGNMIGSHENEEGKIFIESQGWCAMAGIGREEGLVDKALDSCKRHLDSEHGMVLNWPAFTSYHVEMGEISSYPAGYKENAGIFCHNNPWVFIAEALAGRGDDAWEHYTKICPAWIKDQTLHKVEPYVYSQMVAGRDAARPGEGKNSWLTGTAAWNWLAVTQYILGIRPAYDGLEIAPCIPATLRAYTVERSFRDAVYTISVANPNGRTHGVESITVDGTRIQGNTVAYTSGRHTVEVVM